MKGDIVCPPNPEYLIKSIAEQGYSLETAFADLIDNSISAGAKNIELLSVFENDFTIFITDDGGGMSEIQLEEALAIPSSSIETERKENDLGRFGLGLKTASFSQTRELIVLSKQKTDTKYVGLSWDVNYLKQTKTWSLKRLSDLDINHIMQVYQEHSKKIINKLEGYFPNTIVVWKGLYKYDYYLEEENKKKALYSDFSDSVESHLSIAFHRFIEKGLRIQLNNKVVKSFNPFPEDISVIPLPKRLGKIAGANVKFDSIVLPYEAIKKSKEGLNLWTMPNKSLMDMEGIYIYRGDRLISYGGWHGIIKRSGKLQLGRMKIDIGNNIDNILKLNVAKSQIEVPFELKQEFHKSLEDLQIAAQKEFYNVGLKEVKGTLKDKKTVQEDLFTKVYTNKGALLYVNEQNPLVDFMNQSFDEEQKKLFKFFVKNINSIFNKNRQFESELIIKEDTNELNLDEIETVIERLRSLDISEEDIKSIYLSKIMATKSIKHLL